MSKVNTYVVTPSGLTATLRTASAVWDDGMGLTPGAAVCVHACAKLIRRIYLSGTLCFCLHACVCVCVWEDRHISMGSGFLCGHIWWREFEDGPHALLCCSVSSGWLGHDFSLRLFFSSCFVFREVRSGFYKQTPPGGKTTGHFREITLALQPPRRHLSSKAERQASWKKRIMNFTTKTVTW